MPNEQRAHRVRSRHPLEEAPRHEVTKEGEQNKPSGTDAGTLPFPRVASLQAAEAEGLQKEDAQVAEDRTT
jgi:hypothetical protein